MNLITLFSYNRQVLKRMINSIWLSNQKVSKHKKKKRKKSKKKKRKLEKEEKKKIENKRKKERN